MSYEKRDASLTSRLTDDGIVTTRYPPGTGYTADSADWYPYGYPDGAEEDTAPNPVVPALFRAIRRNRWWILAVTVVATALVAFFVYRMRPTFTASTIVEIGQETAKGLSTPAEMADPENSVNINTKILMFSGRPLLEGVVVKLGLNQNQAFLNRSPSRSLSEMLGLFSQPEVIKQDETGPEKPAPIPEEVEGEQGISRRDGSGKYIEDPNLDPFVSILESGMKVDHLQNTQALKISFTHPDPKLAASIANSLAEVFIVFNYKRKIDRFNSTSTWLDDSTRELKMKVQKAEQALADYNRDHETVPMQGSTSLAADKVSRLHEQALRAEIDLQVKQSLYEQVLQGHIADLPEAFSDPRMTEIQKQINQLQVTKAQLSVSYLPENPHMQEVQQQINKLQEEVESSRRDLAAKITSDYNRAEADCQSTKAALDQAKEQAKSEAAQQEQAGIQYSILKQDVDTARTLYNEFLQKTSQQKLEQAQQQNNVSIIRPARIPKQSDGPSKGVLLLLGPLMGMLAGVGIAFVREQLDKTVRSSGDVARFAQLPMLGAIPSIPADRTQLLGKERDNDRKKRRLPGAVEEGVRDEADESKLNPVGLIPFASGSSNLSSVFDVAGSDQLQPEWYSWAAESYRALRTSLLLSGAGAPPKTMLFTSGQAGEGKTTTVVNTAIAFALQGSSVLIIDADLRKPSKGSGESIELGRGLSTYLSGTEEIDSFVQKLGINHLSLLPSGSIPPNPSELLGSERARSLLINLSTQYDYVIIDSSPLMYATDPVILSTMVDAVILVVHSGKTTRDVIRQSREMLNNVGAKIFGVVLNNIDMRYHPYSDLGPYAYYSGHEWNSVEDKVSDILH